MWLPEALPWITASGGVLTGGAHHGIPGLNMDTLHEVAEHLRRSIRTAYIPVYMPCPSPTRAQQAMSRVGGAPFNPGTAAWPTSEGGTAMVFVMQLRLSELPVPIGPQQTGMLQLYAPKGEFNNLLLGEHRWQLLSEDELAGATVAQPDVPWQLAPARRIARWKLGADWPGPDELDDLPGVSNDYEPGSGIDTYLKALPITSSAKLLGWPVWPHYDQVAPNCASCQKPMTYFLQLGELAKDYNGDDYLLAFTCTTCPGQFGLVWGN